MIVTTLARTKKASLAREKLERLKTTKRNRWRLYSLYSDSDIPITVMGGVFSLIIGGVFFIGAILSSWPLWLMILLGIIAGWPIAFMAERSSRNLYEWAAIKKCAKRVEGLWAEEEIFEASPAVLSRWQKAIRDLGISPAQEFAKFENNIDIIYYLHQVDELAKNKPLMTPELEAETEETVTKQLNARLEQIQLKEQEDRKFQKGLGASDQELHAQKLRSLLDQQI